MSELIRREDAINAVEMFFKDAYIEDADVHCADMVYEINHIPAASPWHRVEEPPKEEGRYWFAVWFDGHWIFDAAWYTHDISTVIDVPCCERVGGFYKGNTEVHPDYWMPIEPPKEDA